MLMSMTGGARGYIHQQVQVACIRVLAAQQRSEDTDVSSPDAGGYRQHGVSVFVEDSEGSMALDQ